MAAPAAGWKVPTGFVGKSAVAPFLLIAALAAQSPIVDGAVARGKTLVEVNCSGCHATGPRGKSPNPLSPPFRTLHRRYDVGQLQEALAEGIAVGHPIMPEFVLRPDQINDVIAYLRTLEPKPSGGGAKR